MKDKEVQLSKKHSKQITIFCSFTQSTPTLYTCSFSNTDVIVFALFSFLERAKMKQKSKIKNKKWELRIQCK